MKKRSESSFGLHFDFHADPSSCPAPIGATLREEDIREICTLLRPDFIQIDCKGHPGWASYPSECGNAMPSFAGDPLALWRRVTKEEGVALYMHYSGVIDINYIKKHPGEAAMMADGSRNDRSTRTAGPYVDDLLIPQLKELAGKYGCDGVWVDGDCWGSLTDYDPRTVRLFEEKTGVDLQGKLPATREDPYYNEYREFCRELFRSYVRHYVDSVHAEYPDFQIASNWSYTDHMPEAISADVDFISGDLSPQNSFNSARYAGRAIAQQDFTWDLMSWNFRHLLGCTKHPVQLLQEAAAVISIGGGFQNYITQYRDGSPRMEQVRSMKALADFIRARQDYCFRGRAVHQAALLMSTFDRERESSQLFSRNGCEKIMGLTALLCDLGQSLEIVSEHTLRGHTADYPLLIVPELYEGLEPDFAAELLDYAKNGGSLLIAGALAAQFFADAGLPIVLGGECGTAIRSTTDGVYGKEYRVTTDGESFGVTDNSRTVSADGAEAVAWVVPEARNTAAKQPFALTMPYGRGIVGVIGADLGTPYAAHAQYMHRRVVKAVLDRLYDPAVRVEKAEGTVEVTLLRTAQGKLTVQLVNANGAHRDASVLSEDTIQPCRDVTVSVALPEKPRAVTLQPSGTPLAFTWQDGRARVTVDRVEIHEILVID